MKRLLHPFASLRLTVWLLLAFLLLIFFGTLDQVNLGVRGVQMKYFESFVAVWGYPPTWPAGEFLKVLHIPIPGGYLLGPLFVLNLACAHFRHFRPRWAVGGIVLIHLGILLLVFSQLFTQLLQKEYYISIEEGETVRHLTSFHEDELVIIDVTDPDADTVVAIPATMLRPGHPVTSPDLPFRVETLRFFSNATILRGHPDRQNGVIADRGLAVSRGFSAQPVPPTHKPNERNAATAYIALHTGETRLGTWLVSDLFESTMPAQTFTYEGRTYEIALRFARTPLPYSLTLLDFAHDRYPGTDIPNNFSSQLKLRNPQTGEERNVLIRMNHPLRYGGLTFYQSGFGNDSMGRADRASHLQVVRNPGWLGPYFACTLVSLGLVWQFGWGLLKFGRRRRPSKPTAPQPLPLGTTAKPALIVRTLLALLALSALYIITNPFLPSSERKADKAAFDLALFAQFPVLDGGRVKPLDTLASNTLLLTRSKQTALDPAGHRVPAIQFLAELLFDPASASAYRVFRLDNPDLLDLVDQPNEATLHLSYADLHPYLRAVDTQARLVPEEAVQRTPYHNALLKLHRSILRYQALEYGILPPVGGEHNYLEMFRPVLEPGGESGGSPALAALLRQQANSPGLLLIPTSDQTDGARWHSIPESLVAAAGTGQPDTMLQAYLKLSDAWRGNAPENFNSALAVLQKQLTERLQGIGLRTRIEDYFNRFQPFYVSLQLYILAFIATALFWLAGTPQLRHLAIGIAALSLLIHTLGLAARIYLSGYAPVTNLYSSSVFVGWAAVLLALPLERLFLNGLATAAASLTGFTTLIIAHNIAVAGGADTMEMMRAVLDSNFWLSTHVTTITIGYSTTFLAGALGILYVAMHRAPIPPNPATAASLKRMVYGMICFALLFSFVGTILGGIWADQSWGRFWGWDPKENGALMIVIWNALILHALRTAMVRTRGLMLLAIAGNIITSWSWFGTNMLGVGLHSYGFMDKAFLWLVAFWISQIVFIALGFSCTGIRKSRGVHPEQTPARAV